MKNAIIFQIIFLILLLTLYSVAEYLIQKHFHPDTTDRSSFLITRDYLIAFSAGIVELIIESIWFPIKNDALNILIYVGLFMMISGLVIRFSAILHAGKSFNHKIQFTKTEDHKLITDGIYKYIRHPSYLGFLVFAVGTQVFYSNPICIVGFYIKLYKFFKDRIKCEENALCRMFPGEYNEYRKKTPTWMFIE